ncbi:MAG: hypothetical protein JWN98_2439 [Abditibacteriota bacterium]|nr:hypothetical protein [Abditibacteriota bacterium]
MTDDFHRPAIIIGGRPIYTHFLNRELLRSVNLQLSDIAIENMLRVLLIASTEHFYSSIAFVWESLRYLPETVATIEKLYRSGDMVMVSNFDTPDEFVSSCQILYSYDADRYPMYFDSIPKNLLQMRPGLVKNQNTTDVLSAELIMWSQNIPGHTWNLLSSNDELSLEDLRPLIVPLLSHRENKGITLSFFEEELIRVDLRRRKFALARLLSLVHLQHYLNVTGADVATGISGLTYFDRLSSCFPVFDISLLTIILRRIGIIPGLWTAPGFPDNLIQMRGSSSHRAFVETLRFLLNGAYYLACKRNQHSPSVKFSHLVAEPLHQILNIRELDTREVDLTSNFMSRTDAHLRQIAILARRERDFAEFADLWEMEVQVNCKKVLLLTATDLETSTIVQVAKEDYGLRSSRIQIKDHTIYTLGTIAGTEIFVAQSEMGTEAPGAMTLTANDVIEYLKPHSVVLVGIAFGLRENEQSIGDILVSKQLCPYDLKKLNELKGKEVWRSRGDKPQASTRLLDRFRSGKLDWSGCDVHFGLIMSGNTLVNSPSFIDRLKEIEPEAIGGEMEGAGLYCVGAKRKVDWIVVKGLSDWGINKSDEFQRLAAHNAVQFTFHVISTGGLSV